MPNPIPPEPSLPEAVTDEELENIKARIARHEDWSVRVDRLIARIDEEFSRRQEAEDDNAELRVSHGAIQALNMRVNNELRAAESRLAAAEKALREIAENGHQRYRRHLIATAQRYFDAYQETSQ